MSRERYSKIFTPRTELPWVSRRGENVAMPSCPGSVPMRPPATPDFAGIPTPAIQRPAPSYMPAELITARVRRQASALRILSPVTGWVPPLARVADMTERSRVVTRVEHWWV